MSNLRKIGVLLAFFALSGLPAWAQEREISLKEALDQGYKAHPSLAQAQAAFDASQAKVSESLASWMPSLTGSLSWQYGGSKTELPGASGPAIDISQVPAWAQPLLKSMGSSTNPSWKNGNSITPSLTLNQTIYDFGRTSGGYDAAKESGRSAKADIAATRETVTLGVIQSYYAFLAALENQTAMAEIKAQMAKHLEQARAQAEKGTRTRIDVTRAESDLANAELSVLKAKSAVANARLGLNNAMGRFDLGEYKVVNDSHEVAWPMENGDALVHEAQNARPDIISLRAKLRAVQALRQTAIGGFLPVLGGSAGYSYLWNKTDDDQKTRKHNWFVGLNLNWNFLGGLTAIHNLHENEANVRALRASLQTLENGVRVDVESALVAGRDARDKIAPSEALLKSAKETLELAEARYQAGLGTIVDVTDAEAQYAQARVGLIGAQFDLQTARAKIYKALGRLQTAHFGS